MVIVLVLYRQKLEDSLSFTTLDKHLKDVSKKESVQLLVYDNSPVGEQLESITYNYRNFEIMHYVHDSENSGLASAYEMAADLARNTGEQWLMLLDQDTYLTHDYLNEAFKLIENTTKKNIVFVPQIVEKNKILSPLKDNQPVIPGRYVKQQIAAINSGTIINESTVREIGGFNQEFPLDYLDHWIFHMLNEKGIPIQVMKAKLTHSLSVSNIREVSNHRLESILRAEKKFIYYYNPAKKRNYYCHFFLRMCKYLVVDPSKLSVGLKVLREKI